MLNLANDEWIDTLEGRKVSIREALLQAHAIAGVFGGSPLETFSLFRLLSIIAQVSHSDLNTFDLLQSDRFDPYAIDRFCDRNPMPMGKFGQAPDVADKYAPKSIGYLTPDLPTGTNAVFFEHHAQDAAKAYCQACVARGLISLSPWQTIGGAGLKASISGTPPTYALPACDTLFDTLIRCWIPTHDLGLGIWAREIKAEEYTHVGLAHGLTFMPRCIAVDWHFSYRACTRCGEMCDVWASEMVHRPGEAYTGDKWIDPYAFSRVSKKGEIFPINLNPGRASRFYPENNTHEFSIKRLFDEANSNAMIERWPHHQDWWVFGAVTDGQAKWIDAWVEKVSR